jgi:hypothetical protein
MRTTKSDTRLISLKSGERAFTSEVNLVRVPRLRHSWVTGHLAQASAGTRIASSFLAHDGGSLNPTDALNVAAASEGVVREIAEASFVGRRDVDVVAFWDGIVDEVSDDTFTATLADSAGIRTRLQGEFLLSDVPDADAQLVRPAALFYWQIGYERAARHRKFSEIRFRRLPTLPPSVAGAEWALRASELFLEPDDSVTTEG